jgi:hypothetical protein
MLIQARHQASELQSVIDAMAREFDSLKGAPPKAVYAPESPQDESASDRTKEFEQRIVQRISQYFSRLRPQFIERPKQFLDLPRWFRKASGKQKRAANTDCCDEVPDSSWTPTAIIGSG